MPEFDYTTQDTSSLHSFGENVTQGGVSTKEYLWTNLTEPFHYGFGLLQNLESVNRANAKIYGNSGKTYFDEAGIEQENTWLDAATAKEEYGLDIKAGSKITNIGAIELLRIKEEDERRRYVLENSDPSFGNQALGMTAQLVGGFLDPLNLAISAIPLVGQVRTLRMMQRMGAPLARAIIGAGENVIIGGIQEALVTRTLTKTLNYQYSDWDSFMNVAVGGVVGAGLHVGGGAIGDRLGWTDWSRHLETGRVSPETHEAALRTAIAQSLSDEEVTVHPIISQAIADKDVLTPRIMESFDDIEPSKRMPDIVRLYKDASQSAKVFERGMLNAPEFKPTAKQVNDAVKSLAGAEKRLIESTSFLEIEEARLSVEYELEGLMTELETAKTLIDDEGVLDGEKKLLESTVKSLEEQISKKEALIKDVDDTLEVIGKGEVDYKDPVFGSVERREDLKISEEPMPLNVETKSLRESDWEGFKFGIKYKYGKNKIDRNIIRRAVLEAQRMDPNSLQSLTFPELEKIASKLNLPENKWYHSPELEKSIAERKLSPVKSGDSNKIASEILKFEAIFKETDNQAIISAKQEVEKVKKLSEMLAEAASCIIGGGK